MKKRCTDPNSTPYKYYGARGITVCERWMDFENFAADMGPRPSPIHQVERIDNDAGYSPENCKWATPAEQRKNQAYRLWILHDGKVLTIAKYRVLTGLNTKQVFAGFKDGSIPECCARGHLFTPENTTFYGDSRWCKECRRASEKRSWERRKPAEYDALTPIQRETLAAAAEREGGVVVIPDSVLQGCCKSKVISALKRKGLITQDEPLLITTAGREQVRHV